MSTYNTTYNFNQGNMNFGQALLYGAFGSLTGGMGCFGGGYGMGIMSPFGMGGSLFSMMGMGGYGMGYGCDSMIGAQVGMSMANLAYGAISQAIEGRGGSGDARKAVIKESNDKIKTLTSELDTLESDKSILKTGFDEKKGTISAGLKSILPTQTKEYTDAKDALAKFDTNDDENGLKIKDQNKAIKALNKEYPTDADKEKKEYKERLAEIKKNIGKLKDQQTAAKAAAERLLEEKANALKEAIKTEVRKKEEAITAKKAELKKAREELDQASANDIKVSKKCDTDEEYNTITNEKISDKNVKDYVKAFNYKFSQYCKAPSSNKKTIAEKAIEVYDKINNFSSKHITSDMTRNMKIMKSYIDNNGKKFELD